MFARMRAHASYANVMATIAVFLALGGGGFALAVLKKNSVKQEQIAPNAVRSSEIASSAVGSEELRDASVIAGKLAPDAIPSQALAPGAVDTTALADGSVTAAKLTDGVVGAAKLGPFVVRTKDVPLADGATNFVTATCEPGERVITGGGRTLSGNADVDLQASYPATNAGGGNVPGEPAVGWTVFGSNDPGGGAATTLIASAICAR
jgi:hypothetical protein